MKLCMEQHVLELYKVYINDDPELTLTHSKSISDFAKLVSVLTVAPDIRLAFTGPLVLWLPIGRKFLSFGNRFGVGLSSVDYQPTFGRLLMKNKPPLKLGRLSGDHRVTVGSEG